MSTISKLLLVVGILAALSGTGLLIQIPYFYLHSKYASEAKLKEFQNTLNVPATSNPNNLASNTSVSSNSSTPSGNSVVSDVLGKLEIASLSLTAPIVEGTDQSNLDAGIGHLSTSALPGNPGLCVLAAHNATWFRHVDQLKSGDQIKVTTKSGSYTYQVTYSTIVHIDANIMDTKTPCIVLESCYPLDALYLTSYRFLVYGEFV